MCVLKESKLAERRKKKNAGKNHKSARARGQQIRTETKCALIAAAAARVAHTNQRMTRRVSRRTER